MYQLLNEGVLKDDGLINEDVVLGHNGIFNETLMVSTQNRENKTMVTP